MYFCQKNIKFDSTYLSLFNFFKIKQIKNFRCLNKIENQSFFYTFIPQQVELFLAKLVGSIYGVNKFRRQWQPAKYQTNILSASLIAVKLLTRSKQNFLSRRLTFQSQRNIFKLSGDKPMRWS